MTRLKTEWIEYMLEGMDEYNRQLKARTDMNLAELIKTTFHMKDEAFEQAKAVNKIAVIPITQGEGIIGSFSESVAAILESMGFEALVMEHTDIDGIYEASERGCDLLFFADDVRYLALNIKSGKVSDNNYATALGFIQGLQALMNKHGKDIHQEKILLIGYGIVGREAEKILAKEKIDFDIFDKDDTAIKGLPYPVLTERNQIKNYPYILDFTNEGEWLKKEFLHADLLYASPGVPYSMDEEAKTCFEERSIHDNLEIGTAVMLGQILAD
ncbi:3-methylornithyl-N6-L-lysine dehydrogenase PylD [Aminipila luticellarii]|nr:3-methylornithyl-N6-L-lysine dehydrogenase PylD [Aminipila luticellarii]